MALVANANVTGAVQLSGLIDGLAATRGRAETLKRKQRCAN